MKEYVNLKCSTRIKEFLEDACERSLDACFKYLDASCVTLVVAVFF